MYHYRESGLPNVYLQNGYREVKTAYGPSVVIQDVEGLHCVIAAALANESPHLTGAEVRFIRRYMDKTQAEFAVLLGVTEQSVRRWESLLRIPLQADRAVRLLVFNSIDEAPAIEEVIAHTEAKPGIAPVNFHFRPRAREWESAVARAA
jgi:DNA-binding transcriptional regulator YiaG